MNKCWMQFIEVGSQSSQVECPNCGNVESPIVEDVKINGKTLRYFNCSECEELLGFGISKEELIRVLGHELTPLPIIKTVKQEKEN